MNDSCRAQSLSKYLDKKGISNQVKNACSELEDGVISLAGKLEFHEIDVGNSYVNLIKITKDGPVYIHVCERADELLMAIKATERCIQE
jgi:hypothetical protein